MNLFSEALPVKVDFLDSLLILVIGMAVIFTALVVLILTVNGCSLFFKLTGKKKKAEVKTEPVVVEENNDEEIVAAIMAAITAIYAEESDDGEIPPFRVKSIIRK